MTTTTITALTAGTALAGTEVAPFDQSGATVKITSAQIKTWTSASPTLVTPNLGTPSAGVLSSCTAYPLAQLTGAGTGVLTALAVNVGSAGAFVTFNGALGTPSSGTLTSCTGLPAAGVVGTAAILGANTFTATQTINPAANTSAITISGGSITGSGTTVPGITVAGTLNTSGSVLGAVLYGRITNTASGANTTLIDVGVGATPSFKLRYDGVPIFGNTWSIQNSTGALYFLDQAVSGYSPPLNVVGVQFGGSDAGISRNAAGVLEVNSTSAGTYRDLKLRNVVGQTGYTEMAEMTAPGAGAANTARIYAVDNGAGKTQLMVIFASGAAQQIAIEP